MQVTRSATLTRGPSTPDGIIGKWLSDSGFTCLIQERPADCPDHPAIKPGRYLCTWEQSPREGWCYRLEDRDGRTHILIHKANVFFQLLGCLAPGELEATFAPNSIHPDMPPRACRGVTSSGPALEALEADMRHPTTRQQLSFYLLIE